MDSAGNVVLTGYFSGTVSFGGSNLVSAGGYDIFLAKFDGNGQRLWSKSPLLRPQLGRSAQRPQGAQRGGGKSALTAGCALSSAGVPSARRVPSVVAERAP